MLVIAAAWAPALAAVAVGSVTGLGWEHVLRMVVVALVYAPVSAIVLGIRQRIVAAVTAGIAVSSGATALVMVLRRAPEFDRLLASLEQFGVAAMHLSELAALGILIWMLGPRGSRAPGLIMGGIAILCDVGLLALRFAGVEIDGVLQLLPLGLALLSFFVGVAVTVGRWMRTDGIPRIVLAWFAVGALLLLSSYALVLPGASSVVLSLGTASFILAQSLLPTAILAAVFGGAGAVINRRLVTGMVWAQALACAIGLYVVVDAVARALGAGGLLAGGLAAALLALTFSIMLGVFHELTGLIFFGPGSSVRRVLSQLGSRLSNDGSGDGLQGLTEALREIWHLRSVTVLIGAPGIDGAAERGSWVEIVCVGEPGPATIEHELRVADGANGRILCTADDPAILTNIVGPMLEQISGFVAISVQLALGGRDLAALRDRTRGVRREERRVLHRELHDELAPALAGIGFALAGARRMLVDEAAAQEPEEPTSKDSRASAAIAEVQEELAETAERTRRLARALLPAALDAGDLEGALHELASRFNTTGCRVTISAPGSDRLGNETQIAVYLVLADTVEVVTREAPGVSLHLELHLGEATGSPQGWVTIRMHCDPMPTAAAVRVSESIARRCSEAGGAFESALESGRGTVVLPK